MEENWEEIVYRYGGSLCTALRTSIQAPLLWIDYPYNTDRWSLKNMSQFFFKGLGHRDKANTLPSSSLHSQCVLLLGVPSPNHRRASFTVSELLPMSLRGTTDPPHWMTGEVRVQGSRQVSLSEHQDPPLPTSQVTPTKGLISCAGWCRDGEPISIGDGPHHQVLVRDSVWSFSSET